MEISSGALEEESWDSVRQKGIFFPETAYGSSCAVNVINEVSTSLQRCQWTQRLLPYLGRRKVVTNEEQAWISGRVNAAEELVRMLKRSTANPGRRMMESLYLALLDCFEETQSVWCHRMATGRLRLAVMSEVKATVNYYDMRVVVDRLTSAQVTLTSQHARQLRTALHQSGGGGDTTTQLRDIVRQRMNDDTSFDVADLVLSLMMTPQLGKYVALLLPHCCCNPPAVYEVLLSLQHQWTVLALHLGYTNADTEVILRRAGGSDIRKQIRLFLRVWWMPDCGWGKTKDILQKVIQEKLSVRMMAFPMKDDGHDLLRVCKANDWHKAAALIESGSYLDASSEDGRTPLMHACLHCQDKVVTALVDNGANPHLFDKNGDLCLHYPTTLRTKNILTVLLNEYKRVGFSVDVGSRSSGLSPLSISCKCGALISAELLLKCGANPNGCSNGLHRPLVEACAQSHAGLVKLLLKHKANVNTSDKNGMTPLMQACHSNSWDIALELLKEGADPNKRFKNDTPLFAAVTANKVSIVEALLQRGAVVDIAMFRPDVAIGRVELTPLAYAAQKGYYEITELLLTFQANVNYLCSGSVTPVAFAIAGDHIELFHLLLKAHTLDKSIEMLSFPIMTSVKAERFYYTKELLDLLGGPEQAYRRAQQQHMLQLMDEIRVYMKYINHPHLSNIQQTHGLVPPLMVPSGDFHKITGTLTTFCKICVSAVLESSMDDPERLVAVPKAMGYHSVARFFEEALSATLNPGDMNNTFLSGDPSPLHFIIENNIINAETFQVEVLKFKQDRPDDFYQDLIWTFRHMPGGATLPNDNTAMLTQLFSGSFVPRYVGPSTDMGPVDPAKSLTAMSPSGISFLPQILMNTSNGADRASTKHEVVMPAEESHPQLQQHTHVRVQPIEKPFQFKGINEKLKMVGVSRVACGVVREHSTGAESGYSSSSYPSSSGSSTSGTSRSRYVPDMTSDTAHNVAGDSQLTGCTVTKTGTVLGRGFYAQVVEVKHEDNLYAAKIYHNQDEDNFFKLFSKELHIYTQIRHPNIVSCYGLCKLQDNNTSVIVMEKMDTSLHKFLQQGHIAPACKFRILHDVLKGLNYLHQKQIIHRDLTVTNVLLDSNHVAQISDFGNSRVIPPSRALMTSKPGTLLYMPPEAQEHGCDYGTKIDIFSFGHLSLYVLNQKEPRVKNATYKCGHPPKLVGRTELERRDESIHQMKQQLCGGESHPLYLIVSQCLDDEPDMRQTCQEILSTDFFTRL